MRSGVVSAHSTGFCGGFFAAQVLTIACVRSRVLVLLLVTGAARALLGQGRKIRSEYGLLTRPDPDQTLKRESWFRHGRVVPDQSSAALRVARIRPRRDQTQFRMTHLAPEVPVIPGPLRELHGHCQRHGRDRDAEHAGGTHGPIKRSISMPVSLVYVGRRLRASSSAPRTGSITPGLMAASGCSERRRL